MICKGDTVGVFQIESRAQMAMLPRLRPRTFYDLVIEISIVRPGPIAGDMVHPYLRRRHGREPVTYPHPCLEPVLKKTLGVPLFQEQVIRLAVVAADYTPGEADQLRRDMAAWRKTGRIERHRKRLVSRMVQKGIKQAFAERVFEQILGFGEYGFPESHAASFALIAYATAWLKCHHPEAFACALLNAQPMGFYTPATIVEDAKRHGVEVRPVDVRVSHWDSTLEPGGEPGALALRMGLRLVKGLGEKDGQRLALAARVRPFHDLEDLVRRCGLSERQLIPLAECGALEGLGLDRRQALWELRRLVKAAGDSLALPARERLPDFTPLTPAEIINWDYRASHHSPRGHPLGPLRPLLRSQGLPDAATVARQPDGATVSYAGLVINRQMPSTAGGVVFMTMEDESGFVNLVLFKPVFQRHAAVARTEYFFGVTGKLQNQDGVVHLLVDRLWAPRLEQAPAHAPSRDFH
jgi:error-prone DNA polymerase